MAFFMNAKYSVYVDNDGKCVRFDDIFAIKWKWKEKHEKQYTNE